MSRLKAPEKGEVLIQGMGRFPSWVVGDWMIVEMTGKDVGARGSSRQKNAYLLRHLPSGKEHKIIPDYENDYDLNYALWYVKKLEDLGK